MLREAKGKYTTFSGETTVAGSCLRANGTENLELKLYACYNNIIWPPKNKERDSYFWNSQTLLLWSFNNYSLKNAILFYLLTIFFFFF